MGFQLSSEQQETQQWARELADRYFSKEAFTWEETGEYPWQNAKVLAEKGILGMVLDPQDGGLGSPLLDALLVLEQIAQVCPHTGDIMHQANFGATMQVAKYALSSLKGRVLPRILSGEALISSAMTEPNAGSASTDMEMRAEIIGDKVVINGSKVFNTNGPYNTYFVVWVKFGSHAKSAGAVLVERDAPGFVTGPLQRHMSGEAYCSLYFDQCVVPLENVLVDHDGFRRLFAIFNIERLSNATRALALAQKAFDLAVAYAKQRTQFGRRLCEFEGLQWKFADMKTRLDAARLLIYRAASELTDGVPSSLNTSIAKLHANESAFYVANEALQILGGYGYSRDSPLAYIFRRVRGWMIAGGTIEILRNRIAEDIFGEHFSQRR